MNAMDDVPDASRDMLDGVTMGEVTPQFMMQRVAVEPAQLLATELLPVHNGLVVDMGSTEYLPAVSYAAADDLLGHDLTEEDRNLAAALVAVQLVQQQKHQHHHQQQQHHHQHHHHHHQQHQQQDSNVIVSAGTLAPLVSASHLADSGKVELTEQQQQQQQPLLTGISGAFLGSVDERHLRHTHLPPLKKYEEASLEASDIKKEFVIVKSELEPLDEGLQPQRDSDCDTKNDARPPRKSLPHKKRISRKLKKTCTASRRAQHRCTLCGHVFSTADELAAHPECQTAATALDPLASPFSCQICGAACSDQLCFFEHLKAHYEPTARPAALTDAAKDTLLSSLLPPLDCLQCGKTFRRQRAFEAHVREAHAGKPEDEFSEPEDLLEGIRGVVEAHGGDSADDLPPNSKVWYEEDELVVEDEATPTAASSSAHHHHQQQQQQQQQQQPPPPHGTQYADGDEAAAGRTSDAEAKAARARKKRRKPGHLFCPHCDRVFSHRNSLMYHMRGHTGERPHQCDICGKSFFAASALKVHMRLHSGDKPYKCEYCGRHFRQWGDLKYHCISIHSDQKQYQCEYCGKDFARKYSLIVHRRIHTGEKNYRCEFCGKTFRASSYLQNHRRIHTGEKPHPCEVCGKPFRVRSDMKRHLNTHTRRRNARPAASTAAAAAAAGASTVIQVQDTGGRVESIVPDEADAVLDHQDTTALDDDDPIAVDPLETVREGTNTLYVMPLLIT